MKTKENEIMDEKNCEIFVWEAITQYSKKGLFADALFWRTALPLLRKKWMSEVVRK